jgi:hypothetical protein
MGTWILIAIFGTIAVTAGLVAILQRANGQGPRRRNDSGDGGSVYADSGSRRGTDSNDSDGGSDGGGDGGGGGD